MKICAGAWLNCVVCIDRMMAMSSASFDVHGSSSDICAPDWPCWRNANGLASSFGVPLMKAKRSPLTNSSGTAWPSCFVSAGFGSKRSSCDGAPAMNRWMTRFALAAWCRLASAPGRLTTPESLGLRGGRDGRIEQRRQRQAAEPEVGLLEEEPAGDRVELASWELGIGN